MATVLIVARDLARARPIHAALAAEPIRLVVAADPAEASRALGGSPAIDVVLVEGRSLADDGAAVIAAAGALQPEATVAVFDEPAALDRMVDLGALGHRVLTVPLGTAGGIRRVLGQALERTELLRERALLRAAASPTWQTASIDRIARREGADHARSIVTSLHEAVLLHDAAGALRGWNESAVRLLGGGDGEGVALDPLRQPERFRREDGSAFPPGEHPTALALARGESSTRVIMQVRGQGDQPVWVQANVRPIREGRDGHIVGAVSSLADITEQVQLREDERRLRGRLVAAASEWVHTFDSVGSSIAVMDAAGVIRRVNRAARDVIDLPYADIVGRPLAGLPGEPWATALRLLEAGQPGSSPAFDARVNRHWEVTLGVMNSGDDLAEGDPAGGGAPSGAPARRWVMSAREVTRLIELQASLGRARIMAAMGALVAEVAHEVRNPLFALSATVDVFEARFGGEPDCARYVEPLRAQIGRLRRLMQDLLDYGEGAPADRREPARFEALVAEAVCAAEPGARERAITIVQDDAPALPDVPANPARLVSAIHNLIQNAIQHSPAGSVVRVSTRLVVRGERLVECSVSDSGPGFRDEDLPRVFLPFFTRRTGGTGLGLTIVQHIVESHEGTIEARNIPAGGAMITFRLPVERPAERSAT